MALIEHRDYRKDEDIKNGAAQRAIYWLKKAQPNLKGLDKKQTNDHIAKLEKILPIDINKIDWSKMTKDVWKQLFNDRKNLVPLRLWLAPTHATRQPGVTLGPDDKVRVVPFPDHVWQIRARGGAVIPTNPYIGVDYYDAKPGDRYGRMAWAYDKNGRSYNMVIGEVITGPGELFLHTCRPRYSDMSGKGECPTLIIPILDE